MLEAGREVDSRRRSLEDVGAPVRIEDLVRPAEEMSEGLAVVAVADEAVAMIG